MSISRDEFYNNWLTLGRIIQATHPVHLGATADLLAAADQRRSTALPRHRRRAAHGEGPEHRAALLRRQQAPRLVGLFVGPGQCRPIVQSHRV
ncbi:unnamed protein product [Trichogramma brassicae]|uniref:Uncharacterized protein n=1 Tax=Trichogramma brassicae TaxID=86971 RepID=A0A6H5IJS8_9HYME|nr:unnamed protein product [Trichogramma brassicae]